MCSRSCLYLSLFVFVLAWLFNPFDPDRRQPPHYSYDQRIKFNLDKVQYPTYHSEIVEVVQKVIEDGGKLRVVAAGHSWSEIATTQDVMISLHKYSGIIEVDEHKLLATVKAGTILRNLSLELDKKGLAMINLGSVADQSLAGAISTATHGTGLTVGNMASLVTKVKFVSGTGKDITLSEGDKDVSDFQAAVVSIGAFGVLSEITIRVKKAFNLKEVRTQKTLTDCLAKLETYATGHKYVKMWIESYNNFCGLYQTEETTEDSRDHPGMLQSYLTYYTFAIATRLCYLIPSLTPTMMYLVDYIGLRNTNHVDKSYLIFNNHFDLPIHQEAEIIVPYEKSRELVTIVRDLILEKRFPVNYITEVRFIKGDDIYLSPQFGMTGGSCAVTLTIFGPEETVKQYFDAVYEATRGLKGRIHWGKHFSNAGVADFKIWYPKFSKFVALQKKYDPSGIFVNDFMAEKFNFTDNN